MTIVVAGGTGLIGRPMVNRLAADGHRVFLLTRNPGTTDGRHPANVQAVLWNPVGDYGWMQVVDGADAVINLAGEPMGERRWSARQKRSITESRVNATRAVVEAIRRAKFRPPVFVSGSAIGIYGNVPEGDLSEDSPPGSDFVATTCRQWEAEAARVTADGVRVVQLRIGVVLAKEGGALARMLLPYRFFVGGPIGSGRQWLSWIHPDDLISAVLFVLEHPEVSGPVNLTGPEPVRMKQFAKTLGRTLRRPSFFPAPSFLVRLLFGEMSIVVLGGQRVLPQRLEQTGFRFRYAGLEPALHDILSR
jgi:uncharacterized protein (TIGR01777 family)